MPSDSSNVSANQRSSNRPSLERKVAFEEVEDNLKIPDPMTQIQVKPRNAKNCGENVESSGYKNSISVNY